MFKRKRKAAAQAVEEPVDVEARIDGQLAEIAPSAREIDAARAHATLRKWIAETRQAGREQPNPTRD